MGPALGKWAQQIWNENKVIRKHGIAMLFSWLFDAEEMDERGQLQIMEVLFAALYTYCWSYICVTECDDP